MSSLAATQADGYYLPPEYYESQNGKKKPLSKNQWYNQKQNKQNKQKHHQQQAAAHNQFAARGVVRFELPYPALCLHCDAFLGRGSRFNAQKIKTNQSYYTTAIYEFVMTCPHCGLQEFRIRTNPRARGFDYVQGLQKLQRQHEQQQQQSTTTTTTTNEETGSDWQRLEQVQDDQRRALSEHDQLVAVQSWSHQNYRHDSDGNATLRHQFRRQRRRKQQREKEEATPQGWTVTRLLPGNVQDQRRAQEATFGDSRRREQTNFQRVRRAGIFLFGETDGRSTAQKRRRIKRAGQASPRPDDDAVVSSSSTTTILLRGTRRRRKRHASEDVVDLSSVEPPPPPNKKKKSVRRLLLSEGVIVVGEKPKTTALDALADYYGSSSDSD